MVNGEWGMVNGEWGMSNLELGILKGEGELGEWGRTRTFRHTHTDLLTYRPTNRPPRRDRSLFASAVRVHRRCPV